jgi:hypothetical protein
MCNFGSTIFYVSRDYQPIDLLDLKKCYLIYFVSDVEELQLIGPIRNIMLKDFFLVLSCTKIDYALH